MKSALFVFILLAGVVVQAPAQAAYPRLYYYDGDSPMVTFMLNMMDAMGIIERYPSRGGGYYGRYRNPRSAYGARSWGNRWSPYRNYGIGTPYAGSSPWSFPGVSVDDNPWLYQGIVPWRDGYNSYSAYPGYDCSNTWGCVRPTRLDGLWMNSDGELLGIRANQMVWGDGYETYAWGTVEVTPKFL